MRLLLLSLCATIPLIANTKESCNTVQLFSLYNSSDNKSILEKQSFPSMCKTMEIGKGLTIRCGCFDNIKEANKLLSELHVKYKDAYIASTYKYRFEDVKAEKMLNTNVDAISIPEPMKNVERKNTIRKVAKKEKVTVPVVKKRVTKKKEEELKIIVQTFIYNNELEYAYKAASIAYRSNPNSYYWNQKMAEISRWSGRGDEAIQYMRFMYDKTNNRKLENELIAYGLDAYQYENIKDLVLSQTRRNPTEKNIDKLVLLYDRIGIPEESAEFLMEEYAKNKSNHIYLSKALKIYINLGEMEEAQKIVDKINQTNSHTLEDIKLISYFHYSKRDMQSAYDILLVPFNEAKDLKYYKLVSDLGWYLQKYENAALGSLNIIEKYEARLVDYERVIQVNKDKDNNIALNMSFRAYEKYKSSYLFYSYSLYALRDKKYDDLQILVNDIDASDSSIKKDADYWVIKSTLYTHSGDIKGAKKALQKALKLKPDSLQTQLTAITLYMDNNMNDELRVLLQKLEENPKVTGSLYYVLASSYLYISDINKASFYMDKLIQAKDPLTESIDFKLFQADIFSIKNNENAFMTKMYEVKSALEKEAVKNPKLMEEDRFLNNYLKVSLYIMHVDDFSDELLMSKSYLSEFNYNNLSYAFASRHQSTEKAHTIYQKTRRKEPWLLLANAMQQQEHNDMANLLEHYLELLPLGDASQAASRDGQVSLSQSIAYKALAINDDNQNAYIQHLDLSRKRSDEFSGKIASLARDPIVRRYVDLDNALYLNESWYLLNGLNYYINSLEPNLAISTVPDDTLEANIGAKKIFRRGYMEGNIAYVSSMDTYFNAYLKGAYKVNKYFTISSEAAKNVNALESTELLLAGKKDMLSVGFLWNMMSSTSLEFLYERNRYTGQDDTFIGNGEYLRTVLGYQIKNGYPDMRISAFYDRGAYTETAGSRGIIDSLQIEKNPVLPNNFYNLGVGFSYGTVNSTLYTRVWRPYVDVNGYYNSDLGEFNYGLDLGYGGKVFAQDHMTVGMSYSESLYGNGGKVFELFLRYQFFYVHPGMF